MNQDGLRRIAQNIISSNVYLTLATADREPWAAPLFYCTDDEYNFYFISQLDSLHTQHILKNPRVAFAIFDSHQKEGEGNGVQGSGQVKLLENEAEIIEALKYFQTDFIELNVEDLKSTAAYRLFKLTPEHFYIRDPDEQSDIRTEVVL